MTQVIKDELGSDTTVTLYKDELSSLAWTTLLIKLGHDMGEIVDPSNTVLELTIIGSSIGNTKIGEEK